MLLQPARQREASAREHSGKHATATTCEGSLYTCIANIGELAIAVAFDLVPNGSGRRWVVGVASSHPDHPSALEEPLRCSEDGAAHAISSGCASRQTPASSSAQPASGRGCAEHLSAGWRPPQPDCIDATAAQLSRAIESRWVSGVRAWHGQGAGRVTAVEADGESYCDALDRCVRPFHVPPPAHERSHEDARLPHAPVPWQVMGWLQRLWHESILSICSLSH